MIIPEVIKKEEIKLTVCQIGNMPEGIGGMVTLDNDGEYMIMINADASTDNQAKSFLHEMLHIWNHDFDRGGNVNEIECRTHKQLESIIKSMAADS